MKGRSRIFIVGTGGVGSWLTPSICLLATPRQVTLIDGDLLEEKNMNRQLFTELDIGSNKAEALAQRYKCQSLPEFYHTGKIQHENTDWILCCVDNNRGRFNVLRSCDAFGCQAIFAANETHSAESYYYTPRWSGTKLDPRVYIPEISSDQSGDPLSRGIGCTGDAQEETPQLVSANFMAAALAQHLLVLWGMEAPKLDAEVMPWLPYRLVSNLSRLEASLVGELKKGQQ